MNREQLMKMSKKELKARLVTVGKEAQDKSGEELTALMDEARTIGEILDEIKARKELARAAAAAATEGEEPEDDTKGFAMAFALNLTALPFFKALPQRGQITTHLNRNLVMRTLCVRKSRHTQKSRKRCRSYRMQTMTAL